MSVQVGLVSSTDHPEIIAVTYTGKALNCFFKRLTEIWFCIGWFFGLTTENKESLDLRHGDGPLNMSSEMQERLHLLRYT
jgi:hypothetical protein